MMPNVVIVKDDGSRAGVPGYCKSYDKTPKDLSVCHVQAGRRYPDVKYNTQTMGYRRFHAH